MDNPHQRKVAAEGDPRSSDTGGYGLSDGTEKQGDTCSVSSQHASGERHVSKKSLPSLALRNSGDEMEYYVLF